jgi:hypothetical protein
MPKKIIKKLTKATKVKNKPAPKRKAAKKGKKQHTFPMPRGL